MVLLDEKYWKYRANCCNSCERVKVYYSCLSTALFNWKQFLQLKLLSQKESVTVMSSVCHLWLSDFFDAIFTTHLWDREMSLTTLVGSSFAYLYKYTSGHAVGLGATFIASSSLEDIIITTYN